MSSITDQRILVVTEFAPGAGGGGWVLTRQLLRGLDWNQVYWWSLLRPPASKYQFGGRHYSCPIPARLTPNQRWLTLKGWFLEKVLLPYAERHLLACIREVKPDFILFVAHNWSIPVVYRVMPQVKTHWHLALHDMPDTQGMMRNLGQKRGARFMRYVEDLYVKATSRAVIGPGMAEDMRQRTGIECSNFFRCAVEPEALAKLAAPASKPPADDVIRIGYAGTIVAESTFGRLVKTLPAVARRLNRKIEIHLYTWHNYRDRDWYDPGIIVEHGAKSEEEIYDAFQHYTWGLAIMNLEDDDPRYNRLSFPCKFTAALAAGLPLICIGHRECALVDLAKNYRLGVLLTDEDMDDFSGKLSAALADFSRFDEYRAERIRCAETDFNAERNRRKLHELMLEAPRPS